MSGEDSAAEGLGPVANLAGESPATTQDQPTTPAAFRELVRGEQNLVIIFGAEIRGGDIASLVKFGSGIAGVKYLCLADYANSRGAADMGLYPDLLPGYHSVADAGKFHDEWGEVPAAPGLTLPEMVERARAGKLKALYVVGANPVGRFAIDPFVFSQSFVVVQDMFLTETAALADVVLPAANAYEKSGTLHQHLRRPAVGEEGRRSQRQQV